MKVNDNLTKRRIYLASIFKQYDNLSTGFVKLNSFQLIYQKLVELGYLNNKKHKITEILKYTDPYHKGRIEMNRFMDWMNLVSVFSTLCYHPFNYWYRMLILREPKLVSQEFSSSPLFEIFLILL